jgi:hypothetical protein
MVDHFGGMGTGTLFGRMKTHYYTHIAPSLPPHIRPHWRFLFLICLVAFIPLFILHSARSVETSHPKEQVKLVILIVTFAGGEADRRATLRDTYLQPYNQR